jgi:hypothetical protein
MLHLKCLKKSKRIRTSKKIKYQRCSVDPHKYINTPTFIVYWTSRKQENLFILLYTTRIIMKRKQHTTKIWLSLSELMALVLTGRPLNRAGRSCTWKRWTTISWHENLEGPHKSISLYNHAYQCYNSLKDISKCWLGGANTFFCFGFRW